jgi:hypothetical protein
VLTWLLQSCSKSRAQQQGIRSSAGLHILVPGLDREPFTNAKSFDVVPLCREWSSQDSVDTRLCAFRTSFESFWTDAPDVSMASRPIVERFNVVGHVCGRELPVLVDPFLDSLFLQTRKE